MARAQPHLYDKLISSSRRVAARKAKAQTNGLGWSEVKKRWGRGTTTKSIKEQVSDWAKAQQARPKAQPPMRPSPAQSTKPTPSLKCKQAEEQARAKATRMLINKHTATRVLEQLEIKNVALNAATQNARDRERADPTIISRLWQHSKRSLGQRQLYDNLISLSQRAAKSKRKAEARKVNKAAKKRSESNCLLRGAEQQCAAHLFAKYSGLTTEDGKRRRNGNFNIPLRETNRQRGIYIREKCGGIETACKAMSYLGVFAVQY